MSMVALEPAFDTATFRRVLGHVPTSVAVVTAVHDGEPVGMTVGSFTSISLDPPLVGFFADRRSGSLARILAGGRFAANVLTEDQDQCCGTFAARGIDRFAAVPWHPSPLGSPHLDQALAWVDCDVESVLDIGDHAAVVGRVTRLEVPSGHRRPLVFFRGTLCHLDRRTLPRRGDWQLDHYADW